MCDHLYNLKSSFHELEDLEQPVIYRDGRGDYMLMVRGTCSYCGETIQISANNASAHSVEE